MVEQCDENCVLCRKMNDHWGMMVATVFAAVVISVIGILYAAGCHIYEAIVL